MERRALQIILAVLSLIPLIGVAVGYTLGTAALIPEGAEIHVDLDNQFRYLSGIYLCISLGIWYTLPKIEERVVPLRIVGAGVFFGALGRISSMIAHGLPDNPVMVGGVVLEGVVVPLLLLWQTRLARAHAAANQKDGRG